MRLGRLLADGAVANSLYSLAIGYSHMEQRVLMGREGPLTVSYTSHHPPHVKACVA